MIGAPPVLTPVLDPVVTPVAAYTSPKTTSKFTLGWTQWFQSITANLRASVGFSVVKLDPAAVPANSVSEQEFPAPGFAVNDVVAASARGVQPAGVAAVGARVASANKVMVTFVNSTGAPLVPFSGNYGFAVFRQ